MQKVILTPEEIAEYKPHKKILEKEKMDRLAYASTQGTSFQQYKRTALGRSVMRPPPIIVSSDGYIINGQHRAITALRRGINVEAYVIENANDLIHHVTPKCYGEGGLEDVMEVYQNRKKLFQRASKEGVNKIRDFLKHDLGEFYNMAKQYVSLDLATQSLSS